MSLRYLKNSNGEWQAQHQLHRIPSWELDDSLDEVVKDWNELSNKYKPGKEFTLNEPIITHPDNLRQLRSMGYWPSYIRGGVFVEMTVSFESFSVDFHYNEDEAYFNITGTRKLTQEELDCITKLEADEAAAVVERERQEYERLKAIHEPK